MDNYNKQIKLWSNLGQRASFGLLTLDLIKDFKNLHIVSADVSTSAGLDRFKKKFPNNYIDIGIAEQNMIGIATGLNDEGFDVITTTFAPFQTSRCNEQIKVNLGYMKYKVVMVGLASGLTLGPLGFTHCSIEDLGILRSIPNIAIVSPADCGSLSFLLKESMKYKNSVYIRLTGSSNCPIVYSDETSFKIGKGNILKEISDVTLFGSGPTTNLALQVSEELKKININSGVIDMHTIKPIDREVIKKTVERSKMLISIEEHNLIGGLSSALSEELSKINSSPKLISFGAEDFYSKAGTYDYLKETYGLTVGNIVSKISKSYEQLK